MKLRLVGALLLVLAAASVWAQLPSTTSVRAAGGDILITALGHASVQLERGGTVIIVDPVANQADLSKAKPADPSMAVRTPISKAGRMVILLRPSEKTGGLC